MLSFDLYCEDVRELDMICFLKHLLNINEVEH